MIGKDNPSVLIEYEKCCDDLKMLIINDDEVSRLYSSYNDVIIKLFDVLTQEFYIARKEIDDGCYDVETAVDLGVLSYEIINKIYYIALNTAISKE